MHFIVFIFQFSQLLNAVVLFIPWTRNRFLESNFSHRLYFRKRLIYHRPRRVGQMCRRMRQWVDDGCTTRDRCSCSCNIVCELSFWQFMLYNCRWEDTQLLRRVEGLAGNGRLRLMHLRHLCCCSAGELLLRGLAAAAMVMHACECDVRDGWGCVMHNGGYFDVARLLEIFWR